MLVLYNPRKVMIIMFEIAREQSYPNEHDAQIVKREIMHLLRTYKYSLSQTRELFHSIVNTLEDEPLK